MTSSPSRDNLTTINRHGGPAFKTWLGRMLAENPNGLGSELVETMPGAMNGHDADDVLRAAEALGWIERTMLAPSVSQQAFGGLQYGRLSTTSDDTKKHHASWFMWRVIDRTAIDTFVGDAKPPTTSYKIGDDVRYNPAFVRQIQGGTLMLKARGVVVGFSTLKTGAGAPFPRVAWDDDPKDEVECASTRFLGSCGRYVRRTDSCPDHGRVPYVRCAVSPSAIRKARA